MEDHNSSYRSAPSLPPPPRPTAPPPPPDIKRNWLWWLLAALVVLALLYWFFLKGDTSVHDAGGNTSSSQTVAIPSEMTISNEELRSLSVAEPFARSEDGKTVSAVFHTPAGYECQYVYTKKTDDTYTYQDTVCSR